MPCGCSATHRVWSAAASQSSPSRGTLPRRAAASSSLRDQSSTGAAWATTSRLANRGVLENARAKNLYLNSFDFGVAAARRAIDPARWVRADDDELLGNELSASLNLNDDYVYKFMLALRAVGHYYDRRLKAELISRGVRDVFDVDDEEEGTLP